jgi:hypothetical protein
MNRAIQITALFLDIGGVLLTHGCDHHARKRASTHFKLEWAKMKSLPHMTIDGMRGVLYTDCQFTCAILASF